MDLADSPEEAAFREDVRAWLADALPRLPWPEPVELTDKLPFWRQWQRMLFDAGYAGLSWPREYGGRGADARIRAVFTDETDRAGAPERLNTVGEDFAGPTIIAFGTPEQKERFLRPILRGDELWCQLFSEPESGSDLASLRTTATRVDGGWRISGQKIWTSRAHLASNAILLARTGGADLPRHKGISYFLLPMDADGVTVRPAAPHARRGRVQRGLPGRGVRAGRARAGRGEPGLEGRDGHARVRAGRHRDRPGQHEARRRRHRRRRPGDDRRRRRSARGGPVRAPPGRRPLRPGAGAPRDQPAGAHQRRGRRLARPGDVDREAVLLPAGGGHRRLPAVAVAAGRPARPGGADAGARPAGSGWPTRPAAPRSPVAPRSSSATSSPSGSSACRGADRPVRWELSSEQSDFRAVLADWLGEVCPAERLREWLDAGDHASFEKRLLADGWFGVGSPEELGGEGGGLVELALAAEEFGRRAAPSAAWLASMVALPMVAGVPDAARELLVDGATTVLVSPAGAVPGTRSDVREAGGLLTGSVPTVLAAGRVAAARRPCRGHVVAGRRRSARRGRPAAGPDRSQPIGRRRRARRGVRHAPPRSDGRGGGAARRGPGRGRLARRHGTDAGRDGLLRRPAPSVRRADRIVPGREARGRRDAREGRVGTVDRVSRRGVGRERAVGRRAARIARPRRRSARPGAPRPTPH